jgi:hypothetical protein
MTNQYIEKIFPGITNETIAIVLLCAFCLILLIMISMQNRRISKLLVGKRSISIEDSIVELAKEIDRLNEFKEGSEQYLKTVEHRLKKSVQAIETKRFNPFKGTGAGGNQSFACAFVNENGDGLILSSLYSSDRMSVYAKPIENFKSSYELTEEEENALVNAKDRCLKE